MNKKGKQAKNRTRHKVFGESDSPEKYHYNSNSPSDNYYRTEKLMACMCLRDTQATLACIHRIDALLAHQNQLKSQLSRLKTLFSSDSANKNTGNDANALLSA